MTLWTSRLCGVSDSVGRRSRRAEDLPFALVEFAPDLSRAVGVAASTEDRCTPPLL